MTEWDWDKNHSKSSALRNLLHMMDDEVGSWNEFQVSIISHFCSFQFSDGSSKDLVQTIFKSGSRQIIFSHLASYTSKNSLDQGLGDPSEN